MLTIWPELNLSFLPVLTRDKVLPDRAIETKNRKRLWATQAPNKMKIVLWQMILDCLPTGEQLQHRHISTEDNCVFCGRESTHSMKHM
jgi:hypothetical protein